MKPLSQCLTEAADLIEKKGLARFEYKNCTTGACCMAGAIHEVCAERWPIMQYRVYSVDVVLQTSNDLGFASSEFVFAFSDSHTKDEVVTYLRALATVKAQEELAE